LLGRGISVQVGEVIVGCDAVHDAAVFDEVRRLDLDCQLIRNRGALMVVRAGKRFRLIHLRSLRLRTNRVTSLARD
jgi:hypothetical protein